MGRVKKILMIGWVYNNITFNMPPYPPWLINKVSLSMILTSPIEYFSDSFPSLMIFIVRPVASLLVEMAKIR